MQEKFFKQQDEIYKDQSKRLQLLGDVKTRWNSTLAMIDRFLILRDAVDTFFICNKSQILSMDDDNETLSKISDVEWNELKLLHEILEPFQKMTVLLSGNII